MALTEAQLRATKKYHAKFDRIYIRVTPEYKQEVEAHAEKVGESVNTFVQRAIAEAMERDNKR